MIGIIFATEAEAKPFLAQVQPRVVDGFRDVFTCESNFYKKRFLVSLSGIGPTKGKAAVQLLSEKFRVKMVINAGICGAAAPGFSVGTVCLISQARDLDLDEPIERSVYPCTDSGGDHLRRVRIASSKEPVFDTELKNQIAEWGELIDMEAAAIARECGLLHLPCIMFKGVTDFADESGKSNLSSD